MSEAKTLYDEDFVAWTRQQARALRATARSHTNQPLDWHNLAEEIEDLGKSDRRELRSHIARIVRHLAKLQYSPAHDPRRGWYESIVDSRAQVKLLLRDSPSLKRLLPRMLAEETGDAIERAIDDLLRFGEIDTSASGHLRTTRYSLDQAVGDWFPPEPEKPACGAE